MFNDPAHFTFIIHDWHKSLGDSRNFANILSGVLVGIYYIVTFYPYRFI